MPESWILRSKLSASALQAACKKKVIFGPECSNLCHFCSNLGARYAMGTAVFSGMIGVTFLGLFLTPVFYVLMMKLGKQKKVAPVVTHLPTSESAPAVPHS